jgi:hypothetical protein
MTVITKKIEKKVKKMKVVKLPMKNNNVKYLFSFPFIFYNLDINISDSDPMITQLAYGVFLLSLVAFFCLINILGYLLAYYLIQKGNYEVKYPKFARIINYYKKVNLFFLVIEAILCLTCLTILIFYSSLFII